MEGALSARDRRASDQLKPSPTRRDGLDFSSNGDEVLAEDRVWAAAVGVAFAGGERRAPAKEPVGPVGLGPGPERDARGGYLPFPMLPARASRRA